MSTLSAPQSARPIAAPAPLPVEVFAPTIDADRHRGRGVVRQAVLAMTPISGAQPLLPGPLGAIGAAEGAFWGIRSRNGLTLAIRTATFASALACRRDAVETLTRAAQFEYEPVHASERGTTSYWVLLDERVVLVAGQAWGRPGKSTERLLRQTLARLPSAAR